MNPSGEIPPARSGAASVIVKGRLYMFGGYGGGTGRLDDFYSFSFSSNTWEAVEVLGDARPECRENNGVVIGDSSRVYLFGGYNGDSWLNDLWMFDIHSKRWTCIQESSDPNPQQEQQQQLQQQLQQQVQVQVQVQVGGIRGQEPHSIPTSLLPRSSRATTNGTARNNTSVPTRRFGYVSVVHNGKFVLFGGFDGTRWLNDMYEFDFETKMWRQIHARGQLPSVRSCPAWAKDDTNVYIQGGYDGVERKADFFACDLSTYTWTEMPSKGTPPSPRYFHSCCLYGKKMYAYGGYSGSERLADMYAYDFETNLWSEVDCTHGDSPSGRSSLVAQVYKNSLYLFGGYDGEAVLNDFYKFRLKPVSIPPSAFVADMLKLMNDTEMSDTTFLIEGKEVHAHRAILAARSEYFKIMLFSGGMKESIQAQEDAARNLSAKERDPIKIEDISFAVFSKVLEFLYTDVVQEFSLRIGISLLIASERFMLRRLKALCEELLIDHVCVDNVIGIFMKSHRYNATGLKDISLEYILKHLTNPIIMQGLNDLKSEPDLLVEILKRNAATPTVAQPQSPSGPFGSGSGWGGTRR